jgi:hypothetical protein
MMMVLTLQSQSPQSNQGWELRPELSKGLGECCRQLDISQGT